ncbi:MAG: prepilin peptidase [Brevundimonas sp.]|uniref:A24 family peptidase n=1 Tax=Brevundimonas sp. TaxID=1871086 RepID=UPI002724F46A|nr:prepilin peptidase [Brevundimonas sp.]MDZ4318356.1 prepilin peptidase [Phenylobacterium sp.]MDO9588939.1 prepilin peptidase [Brevundimonas sp.]MDP3370314.1 prepilin peptidase [Brevundimonas sp.]MDP3655699.1 prepilin peptidase [Brevundimonas sp.]MDZ4108975.1 prepilin peptidase [Brevundimonas sp.]
MDSLTLILLGVMPALVIAGGLKDLTSMKIPNWISGVLVLGFFPAALGVGLSPLTVATHTGVAALALVVGAGMFALRWIGGGDAKLMAAACLWLGVAGSGMFLLYTGLVGGVFCLALMVARAHSQPFLARAPGWVAQLMEPKGDIPYGVAIAAGALLAYPASPLLAAFIAG